MTLRVAVPRYAAFAVVVITANLGAERLAFTRGDDGMSFALAVGAATRVGLACSLDQRIVRADRGLEG